jgi:hypothetical protein
MIIYGWGKNFKPLAYMGVEKCPNCKTWAEVWLCEHASYASVYFVKLARWNKKTCLMCNHCKQGFEVPESERDELLRRSINMPTSNDCWAMWQKFESVTQATFSSDLIPNDQKFHALKGKLTDTANAFKLIYPHNHVDYVVGQYAKCLLDGIAQRMNVGKGT